MNFPTISRFFGLAYRANFVMVFFVLSTFIVCAEDAPNTKHLLDLVVENTPDQPRFTPVTRKAMKQYIEDLKRRTPRIPLPELSDEEKVKASSDGRTYGYESRLRSLYLGENASSGYNGFGGSPTTSNTSRPGSNNPLEPLLSLDYGFKVKLFWIAARGNNCQYCLGHQESKLLGVGMLEDEIAALDSDWDAFPEKERVAFALAKRLTMEPHLLSNRDIDDCRSHFSDMQILEMIGSVAGNNAINRWKEGTGVPQSSGGGNFGRPNSTDQRPSTGKSSVDSHSYLTETSPIFESRLTKVASLDPSDVSLEEIAFTQCKRPELISGELLIQTLGNVSSRTPRLPLVDEEMTKKVFGDSLKDEPVFQWHRLLANFPVAGKKFIDGLASSRNADQLSHTLQAQLDWVISRQDRAWYANSLAYNDLRSVGMEPVDLAALDGDLSQPSEKLAEKDRLLLLVAKNLAASPIVLTDRQVDLAVQSAGPKAVTQVINYATYRAAFNRITEAAGLAN